MSVFETRSLDSACTTVPEAQVPAATPSASPDQERAIQERPASTLRAPSSEASVWMVRLSRPNYGARRVRDAVDRLLDACGVPLVRPGERVLIKPNWVLHENASGAGLDCLVSHPAVIEALAERALRAGAARVVIADAPLQACDFAQLRRECGLDAMLARLRRSGEVDIRDLRLVTRAGRNPWSATGASDRTPDQYVLFDLGARSRLEPVSGAGSRFRVTCYDPAALSATHGPGRHTYLIARELIEADVVLNLPKLKTHKKAGLTGALKNLVGVNGHKAYLPHHRQGAPADGGDCYPRPALLKSLAEHALDCGNAAHARVARYFWSRLAGLATHAGACLGADPNLEGAWHGNDTLWRTVLDLQSIAGYGTPDGTLAAAPQRRMVSLTDAIVAGEGDGPLRPQPAPLGLLSLAFNAAAADWVSALLLGLDPASIPSIRQCFTPSDPPLAGFSPDDIALHFEGWTLGWREAGSLFARPVRVPAGWAGRCEWQGEGERRMAC